MTDETALREKARQAILDGRLPDGKPSRVFGGPGSGMECPVCGELAPASQLELELEFQGHGRLDIFHLHPHCFAAWEFERPKLERGPDERLSI